MQWKYFLGGSSSSSQKKKDLRDSLHASYGAWQCPLTSATGGIQGARQVPHSCAAAMMHAPASPTHVSCSNRPLWSRPMSLDILSTTNSSIILGKVHDFVLARILFLVQKHMKLVHRLWRLRDLCIMFSGFVTRLWLEIYLKLELVAQPAVNNLLQIASSCIKTHYILHQGPWYHPAPRSMNWLSHYAAASGDNFFTSEAAACWTNSLIKIPPIWSDSIE